MTEPGTPKYQCTSPNAWQRPLARDTGKKSKKRENYLWHWNNTPPLSEKHQPQNQQQEQQQQQQHQKRLKQVELSFLSRFSIYELISFQSFPWIIWISFFQCVFSIKLDLDSDRSTNYNNLVRTNYWQFYIHFPVAIVWKLKTTSSEGKTEIHLHTDLKIN